MIDVGIRKACGVQALGDGFRDGRGGAGGEAGSDLDDLFVDVVGQTLVGFGRLVWMRRSRPAGLRRAGWSETCAHYATAKLRPYLGAGPRTTSTNPSGRTHFLNAAFTSSAVSAK